MLVDELEKVIIGDVLIEVKDILFFDIEKMIFICVVSGEVINYYVKLIFFIFGGSVDFFYFMMIDIKGEVVYVVELYVG